MFKNIKPKLSQCILIFAVLLGVSQIIRIYFYSLVTIDGESMIPTFENGDVVLVRKFNLLLSPGAVVLANLTDSFHEKKVIKRLAALGANQIYIDNYKLIVNGSDFDEQIRLKPKWDYLDYSCSYSKVYKTNQNEVFLLGDNRCSSTDSRHFGPIDVSRISGAVVLKVIPANLNLIWILKNWMREMRSNISRPV